MTESEPFVINDPWTLHQVLVELQRLSPQLGSRCVRMQGPDGQVHPIRSIHVREDDDGQFVDLSFQETDPATALAIYRREQDVGRLTARLLQEQDNHLTSRAMVERYARAMLDWLATERELRNTPYRTDLDEPVPLSGVISWDEPPMPPGSIPAP